MFESLSKFRIICVTGPQRSGTTICAKMVAHDLGYTFTDESVFEWYNKDFWMDLVNTSRQMVIQCPTMSRECSHLQNDDVLVIFMKRQISDIEASQKRVKWHSSKTREQYDCREGPVSKAKYLYWDKHKPKHYKEVRYSDLSGHPLWIDKEYRKNFRTKQTEM